jgi:hypothetical protein
MKMASYRNVLRAIDASVQVFAAYAVKKLVSHFFLFSRKRMYDVERFNGAFSTPDVVSCIVLCEVGKRGNGKQPLACDRSIFHGIALEFAWSNGAKLCFLSG